MNTLDWLAVALSQFQVPRPESAPPDAEQMLAAAFLGDFAGVQLVHDFAQAVDARTQGRVTLRSLDPQDFPFQVRGPGAYLALVGERRLILAPAAQPVMYVD
jgi:hypothetical protein